MDWVVSAIPPSANDLFQPIVSDGDGNHTEVAIVREARRRHRHGSAIDLKREQNVTFRHISKDWLDKAATTALGEKRILNNPSTEKPDGDATMKDGHCL